MNPIQIAAMPADWLVDIDRPPEEVVPHLRAYRPGSDIAETIFLDRPGWVREDVYTLLEAVERVELSPPNVDKLVLTGTTITSLTRQLVGFVAVATRLGAAFLAGPPTNDPHFVPVVYSPPGGFGLGPITDTLVAKLSMQSLDAELKELLEP